MISASDHYDVVIAGGGMVGSMLAAALACPAEHGEPCEPLRICVLEARQPRPFEAGSEPPYDIRVSALSVASQRMFEHVGAWQGVLARRACAYREMLVWDGQQGGRTHFHAADIHADELGHIVENRVIQLALLEQLQIAESVELCCPATLAEFRQEADRVSITLDNGKTLSARLLVGADGAQSTVRKQAGIQCPRSDYPQQALVATIDTELPQQSITWQRFEATGPQAFLPLCGARASIVWYHTESEVARLRSLNDTEFAAELERCFPPELGSVNQVLERGSFPIAKAHADRYINSRLALVGDAAHTVHPLAGQGVNLGMLDAAALSEVILECAAQGRDIGSLRNLRRYERWRRGENSLMINALDGFYHAFKPQPVSVQQLRSTAMDLADRAGPLKHRVMRYAMGTAGHLPEIAR